MSLNAYLIKNNAIIIIYKMQVKFINQNKIF